MAEQHIQAKLKAMLRSDKILLWNPPYTTETYEASPEHLQALAVRYSQLEGLPQLDVEIALEDLRSQAVKRGKGNKTYRETNVATLELHLPKEMRKNDQKKQDFETKLDITTQELMNKIKEKFELKYMKLILNGKTLNPDKRLDEQNVKNNSKIMVLKVSEPEKKKAMMEVEEQKRSYEESVQRTQKVFQILSERDGSEDPDTTPVLEIADQKGNSIQLSLKEKKVTESLLFCVLCDQIHLAILLLTRNVHQIPFANCLNSAVNLSRFSNFTLLPKKPSIVVKICILFPNLVVDFHRHKQTSLPPVIIQGKDIVRVDSYKYMSVHLNSKLDWTDNTEAIHKKGQCRLFLLRRLRSFGVQRELLNTFFDSVVTSAIFYRVVCWCCSISTAERKRLDKLIRKASSVRGIPLDTV